MRPFRVPKHVLPPHNRTTQERRDSCKGGVGAQVEALLIAAGAPRA